VVTAPAEMPMRRRPQLLGRHVLLQNLCQHASPHFPRSSQAEQPRRVIEANLLATPHAAMTEQPHRRLQGGGRAMPAGKGRLRAAPVQKA
jgi:ribosomal protein L11 methylase PrmA